MAAFYFIHKISYPLSFTSAGSQTSFGGTYRSRSGIFSEKHKSLKSKAKKVAQRLERLICGASMLCFPSTTVGDSHGGHPAQQWVLAPHSPYLHSLFYQPKYKACAVLKMQLGITFLGGLALCAGPPRPPCTDRAAPWRRCKRCMCIHVQCCSRGRRISTCSPSSSKTSCAQVAI